MRDVVDELIDAAIVQESVSDYTSPVLLVRKSNDIRLQRVINKILDPASYMDG